MALGLAREGHSVAAIGHIAGDVDEMKKDIAGQPFVDRVLPMVADIRSAAECDRIIAETEKRFGRIDILVNNAGVTFTYIDPTRYAKGPKKFWEISDEIIQTTMDTNYIAGDRLARRLAPKMIAQGWGRIINVTTKLDTMNRPGSSPYGSSKAALEMATEIWAKEVVGTGLTINIVNPGAGAHTPGMAEDMKAASRAGKLSRFVEADEMVPPLLFVISPEADKINGWRFDALTWDSSLPPRQAAQAASRPAGMTLHPEAPLP
jgi:3-oxoacyl-[acyl-carrier protein] reductase